MSNSPKMPRIFVQIPSYRDRECQWTVADLFAKALHPERVFVGICWQFDPKEDQDCFRVEARPEQVRRVDFHASEAQGLGWARLQAQGLWQGEEYTLQIDSHMRFARDWDELMLEELAACPSRWPVLTLYPASYWPPDRLFDDPYAHLNVQAVRHFTRSGILQFTVWQVPAEAPAELPKLTAAVAGGFLFGPSRIIEDVPSDPEIYFEGEEPNLAARLWTHGFDLFSPKRTLLYHYYRRNDSRRPWDDANPRVPTMRSLRRMQRLLEPQAGDAEILGRFGLGSARSLAEYEIFAGVDFRAKSVASYVAYYPFVYTDEVTEALTSQAPLRPRADAALFLLGDDGVLFSGQRRLFHRLSPVASYCWCALDVGQSPAEIIAGLAERSGLDPEEAGRQFRAQVCHWQTWGVLEHGMARQGYAFGDLQDAKPAKRWPPRPPVDERVVRRCYRLLGSLLEVRAYGTAYDGAIEAVFGHLPEVAAEAIEAAQVIKLLGIGKYHYLVRNDHYPATIVEQQVHFVHALMRLLEEAALETPDAILQVRGGLVPGRDGDMLVLGDWAPQLAALLDSGGGGGPARELVQCCPDVLSETWVQIGRGGCGARYVPLPVYVPVAVADDGAAGADWGAQGLVPFPWVDFGETRPVTRLVVVRGSNVGSPRSNELEPMGAADALAALIRVSMPKIRPASVEDAAKLVGWVERMPRHDLCASSFEQAATLLSELVGFSPSPE